MKKKAWLRLLALCAALALCGGTASANSLSPMEEGMFYTWRIPQAGISVYIPAEARCGVLMDTPEGYALNITYPDTPDTAMVFFALRNDGLDGKEIAGLDEDELQRLAGFISDFPELVEWELLDDVLPGQSVVLMTENRPGIYAEHLVALHGPWVINVMLGVQSGPETLGDTAREHQREALSMALDEDILSARFREYTFPESGVTLTMPESTHMMLLGDEPNFKWLVVMQPGTDIAAVQVYAYWDEAFQGQDAATLDPGILEELLGHATLSGYDADSLRRVYMDGVPVLAYESDFGGETQRHLVGIREGWGFNVVLPGYDSIDQAWGAEAQRAVMAQLLTGEGTLPEMEAEEGLPTLVMGDIMGIPLGEKILAVRIPEGYTYRIDMDSPAYRQSLLYETTPESKKIELIFERDTFSGGASDYVDLTDEEAALEAGRAFADEVAAGQEGMEIFCDYSAESPWGAPMLLLTSADMEFVLLFTQVEGYMGQILWMPSETGRIFTVEEVAAFLSGISILE